MGLREDFEAWAPTARYGIRVDRWEHLPDQYCFCETKVSWEAYKAATERAAKIVREAGFKSNGTPEYEEIALRILVEK